MIPEGGTSMHHGKNPRIFITGDKHRCFKGLIRFCRHHRTTRDDTLIVLGDACFNYFGDERDESLKQRLAKVPVTLFCIQGNKENRPQNLVTYRTRIYRGGEVYYEEAYPSLLFAKDCEVYDFDGRQAIVIGGSHSVDKLHRLEHGLPYWFDEEPDEAVKQRFEQVMAGRNWEIDYVLSHTVPFKYEPTEVFISTEREKKAPKKPRPHFEEPVKQYVLDIDKSVELWLDAMEERILYHRWFAGHYHTDKRVDRLTILQHRFEELTAGVAP